jgi:hypothetical protein
MPIERLDETRPYGTIGGNYQPPGFDRPAVYQQGNRWFDHDKRLIVPNTRLDPADVAADAERRREEAAAKELVEAEATMLARRKAEADRRAREREKAAQNRAKASVSCISPSYQPPDFDRPAHYQFGEKYLDEHGREIVPGRPDRGGAGRSEGARGRHGGPAGDGGDRPGPHRALQRTPCSGEGRPRRHLSTLPRTDH